MICQDVVAAILVVTVRGEERAVVGLLQGAPVVLLTAQVPCRDGEEVLPGLLVRVILGLVVQEDSEDGRHHAQDIGAGDGVPQHDQGHCDDHDSLGGIGDRVAQRADEVEDAEGNDVLGKVTEAADSQEQKCPRPLGHIGQVVADQESREIYQDPCGDHKKDGMAAQDVQQPEMVDP